MPDRTADPTPRPRFHRRAGEAGFALIEAVAAAAVLAVVALGVLAGIDAAAGASGRERVRAVAASLAQQDQERMRSMKVTDLAATLRPAPQPVDVDGTTYTVTSSIDWIRDSTSGTVGCTTDTSQADYLRVTSEVQAGRLTEPVRLTSIVALPVGALDRNRGTLAIRVVDRDGAGEPGITVRLTGTASFSDTTNEAGCAVFPRIPVGNYTASAEALDYVDPAGNPAAQKATSVTSGRTKLEELQYDRRAEIVVRAYRSLAGSDLDRVHDFSVTHTGLPQADRRRAFATSGRKPQESATASTLFPFASAYSVYAGSCAEQDPTRFSSPSAPLSPTPILLGPGARNVPVRVLEPPVKLTLVRGTAKLPDATTPTVKVTFRLRSTATPRCQPTYVFEGDRTRTDLDILPGSGELTHPGLPFGTYDVCLEAGTTRRGATVANTTTAGSAATINLAESVACAF